MMIRPLPKDATTEESWILRETHFDPEYLAKYEAIFTQGNGYLGQRAALEEGYWGEKRDLFVSGTFDRYHTSEVSELPNLPDVTNLTLYVDGQRMSLLSGELRQYCRQLDLFTGELKRTACWVSPQGAQLQLCWQRVVSQADPHLQAAKLTITTDRPVSLRLRAGIDGTVTNTGTQHTIEGDSRVYDGGTLEYPCTTVQSGVQVMTHMHHWLLIDGVQAAQMKIVSKRRSLTGEYTVTLLPGQKLEFEKLAAIHTARDVEYRALSAAEANEAVRRDSLTRFLAQKTLTYAQVLRESAAVWAEFWREHDIRIESSEPLDQVYIRFAIYHLHIMTNRWDDRVGIAAKGLSGEGYKGHSFWDTEIFIFPFFLYTAPETARGLLEYRYHSLNAARELAQKRGYEGAMYPWECGWIEDGDVTPEDLGVDLVTGCLLPCSTGELEHHVTADIAEAVRQYALVTGDMDFMQRRGYEILLETACFWASRVEYDATRKRYEIRHVTGPDEYQEDVNNNAYTNYFAARNMELGLWTLDRLAELPELRERLSERFELEALKERLTERIAAMYLPRVNADGILPQFDGYLQQKELDLTAYRNAPQVAAIMQDFNFKMLRRYKVAKQADVVQLMFLREDLFSGELRRKNYQFYEPRTLHDSSLSRAIHAIIASDLEMPEEAYDMFLGAACTDLSAEPHSCDDGIHSANMGGIWQDVVMGFGGLRAFDGTLRLLPHLPRHWKKLTYRFHWKQSVVEAEITTDQLRLKNSGAPLSILTPCGTVELEENGETTLQYRRNTMCECR